MARKKQVKGQKKKKVVFRKTKTTTAAELGFIAKALRGLGGLAGGAFAGQAGATAGHNLGAQVSRWLGQGDYSVNSNTITSRVASGSPAIPMMHGTGQSIIVRHKEYLTDVVTGIANTFTVSRGFPLNPGLADTFPWLSTVAQQFQEYSIRGMVFHFESSCGDTTGTTVPTIGSFMMGTQYKATSAPYANKLEMLNEYFSSSCKPSEDSVHPIECDPKENPYNVMYVRGGAISPTEDLKTYDLGTFYYATHGLQTNNVTIGELWVTYEVELKKPAISGHMEEYANTARYSFITPNASTNRFGTSRVLTFDSIGLVFPTNQSVTFPFGSVGDYQIITYWVGVTATSATTFIYSNCAVAGVGFGGLTEVQSPGTGITGQYVAITTINIPDPNKAATVTINTSTIVGATGGEIIVTQINPAAY